MELGNGNTIRTVSVSTIYRNIGANLAQCLPALHAFSSCDFLASFFGKGKPTRLKKIIASRQFQEVLIKLGDVTHLEENKIMECMEKLICCMYGEKI